MTVSTMPNPRVPLGLADKLLFVLAAGMAAALFLSVGWLILAPQDPQAAVSLITHDQAVRMVLQTAALAAVTAAIATAIIGTRLADMGVFAAAIGLALAALRGNTATYLLIHVGRADRALERVLAAKLALEAVIWFAVLLVAMLVSGLVLRWCFGRPGADDRANPPAGRATACTAPRVGWSNMAISECPLLRSMGPGAAKPAGSALSEGLKVTAITTFVAMCLFAILVSGSAPQWIRHGQICFAVFAGFFVGTWAARRWCRVQTAFWGFLATPIASVLGYLWAMIQGDVGNAYAHLPSVPPSNFLRALPMTFVAVGTLGVLAAQWSTRNRAAEAPAGDQARRRSAKR